MFANSVENAHYWRWDTELQKLVPFVPRRPSGRPRRLLTPRRLPPRRKHAGPAHWREVGSGNVDLEARASGEVTS